MIKGLAITPPTIGRISIGQIIERNGQRLPSKDDQFTITQQVQTKAGWITHPLDKQLREEQKQDKLRIIPVKVLFSEPELNLRSEYSMFDRSNGRLLCTGNGDTCKRVTSEGTQELPCPGPDLCDFGKGGLCKLYGRLNVLIGDEQDFGSFVFRTTGYNSVRSLLARMMYYQAASGGLLPYLPLQLRLRSKSTTMSRRAPVFYVDMELRNGMSLNEAIEEAKRLREEKQQAGFDQTALDTAAQRGYANGLSEDLDEEIPAVLEEFYPANQQPSHQDVPTGQNDIMGRLTQNNQQH